VPSRTSSRVSSVYADRPLGADDCISETRSVTEPAGALALAGLKRYIYDNKLVGAHKKFVAVVSGANMNFDRLRFVAERAELGEGREALLSVDIPEKAGRSVLAWLSTMLSLTLH
jgi:threonine dehydratase